MPTAVKERLLSLITKDHQKYYDITQFFLDPCIPKSSKELKAFHFLDQELETLNDHDFDFPIQLNDIEHWLNSINRIECMHYGDYLERRKMGGSKEYFSTLSKAYEFLYKVAPVKQVDGSWLYSFTQYWDDPVFKDFIQIYLEELGLGNPKSNHVKVYDNLLILLGLNQFSMTLSDEYYHQPAIQLALAYAPPDFIPEITGFNLGYEQLPLHLLITNYELNELGIDSKYFNLHITIDNFQSGHAKLALNAIQKLSKKYKSQEEFIRKVKLGFMLNNKGFSSSEIIKKLSTEEVVHQIFKKKAVVGKLMHNGHCKFSNKSINEWLEDEHKVEDFISELIKMNWIKLNQDPNKSRFWKLINDEDGKMFGVFTSVEKTFIYDWISGNQAVEHTKLLNKNSVNRFMELNDFNYLVDDELLDLQKKSYESVSTAHKLNQLMPFLAPHIHHTEIGLWSTQRVLEYLFPFLKVDKI